jgi:YegS/Rv2252/BmrU family lipid kinase
MQQFLAIVNPAAGGGRSAKLAGPALARLRAGGIEVDAVSTSAPSDAVRLAREGYAQGYRKFLAVGGDGTGHEILNGIFSSGTPTDRVAMGFLPLGTGNSFLRDYTRDGAKASLQALLERRTRSIDLMRLAHASGEMYSFNLVSVGFTANVGALTNRYFKPFGHLGYLLGVFVRLAQLRPLTFAVRCDEDQEWNRRPCLFLTFNNSAYTGGTMWIAPDASASDGLIEFVHWGPIGRIAALRMLPTIYDGRHMRHPQASRRAVRHVEFNMPQPVDVMVDGEVMPLQCRALDIVPAAVDVYI